MTVQTPGMTYVTSVSFSPDSMDVAYGTCGECHIFNLNTSTTLSFRPKTLDVEKSPYIKSISFSSNQKWIAFGIANNIEVWNWAHRKAVGNMIHCATIKHRNVITSLTFSPDSSYMVAGQMNHQIKLYTTTQNWSVTKTPHKRRASSCSSHVVGITNDFTKFVSSISKCKVKLSNF